MSAWVVEKAHVNLMVDAALATRYKPFTWYTQDGECHQLTDENRDEVGQMLMDECVKSVCYRYDDSEITDLPGRADAEYLIPFKYKMFATPPPPVVILKQVRCYMYQSCEHNEWETSSAKAFCDSLISSLIGRLPGYEEAPWGWEEWPPDGIISLTDMLKGKGL